MPQDNAASTGVISEPAQPTTETVSTAVAPETPTQSTSTSLLDAMGIPAEAQKELKALREETPEPEPDPVTTTEEAPPETVTEDEPGEVSSEEEPKPEQDWSPEVQAAFKKRIGKAAKKARLAEEKAERLAEELEQAKAQLESTQPITVAPHAGDAFANVQTEEQLQQILREAKVARDWCRKNPQGAVVDEGKDNERVITPEEVAETLGKAEDAINEHIPSKRVQIIQRRQLDEAARQVYPNMFDRTSEDYTAAMSMVRQLPGIANHPGFHLIMGDYIAGVRQRLGKDKAQPAPPTKTALPPALSRPIPPIAPPVASAPRGESPSRKSKVDEAMNRHAQEGSRESAAAVIRAKLDARDKARNRELVPV